MCICVCTCLKVPPVWVSCSTATMGIRMVLDRLKAHPAAVAHAGLDVGVIL